MLSKKFVKIIISIALLTAVYLSVDLSTFAETIGKISPKYVALITACYVLGQLLSTLKWWLIVRASGIESTYIATSRAYFLGMFVNCFALGMIGGDLTRGILVAGKSGRRTQGVATVIADRAQGLAVLALIGIIAWLFINRPTSDSSLFWYVCSLGILIVLGWVFGPAVLLKIFKPSSKFRTKAEEVSAAFPKDGSTLFVITLVSAIFHLWQIYMHWIIGLSLGLDLNLVLLIATVPFVNILSSLPISWNGLGVREAGYIFFLTPHTLSNEQALIFGAIWILATTFASLIGGVMSLITPEYKQLQIERASNAEN